MQRPILQHDSHDSGDSPDRMQVLHDVTAGRLEVGEIGRTVADPLEVLQAQLDVDCMSHCDEMQDRVRRTSQHHRDCDGVFECLPGHDLSGSDVLFQQAPDGGAGCTALIEFAGIRGGSRRAVRQAHAQGFDGGRHRIGGVHAPTGACARAGKTHDLLATIVIDATRQVLAVGLECGHDVQWRVIRQMARSDRSSVDHDRGAIDPPHRHHRARHVLVAAGDRDVGVVPLSAHHRLDRVGDEVARLERVAHALGAHRDAVGDTDGVEAHSDHARGHDALFDPSSELIEVHVAGIPLVPDRGDADLRLVHVVGRQAGGIEHRLAGALRCGLGDAAAGAVEAFGHHRIVRTVTGPE